MFDLDRFVTAQDADGVYERAVAELRGGQKTSHWMWFVFPQVAGLGHSQMARRFAIASLDEAVAYLHHPVLGPRLRGCSALLAGRSDRTAEQIFGPVDAQKLHSSVTLFMRAAPEDDLFQDVLDRYFGGLPDNGTDDRL